MGKIPRGIPRLKCDGRGKRIRLPKRSPTGVERLAADAVARVNCHNWRKVASKIATQSARGEFD
jgi:hypothetical protein